MFAIANLDKMLPHFIALLLMAGVALLAIKLLKEFAKSAIVKYGVEREKASDIQKGIEQTTWVMNVVVVVLFVLTTAFMFAFFWAPMARDYEQMDRITEAKVDETYTPPTKEDIETSNKEAEIKHSEEDVENVEKEVKKSMDSTIDMFKEAAKEADANRNN